MGKNNLVVNRIEKLYHTLFPAEMKVADYILGHVKQMETLTVTELAQKSGVSDATVVRMCRHLGYDGYIQMRLLLAKDLGKYEIVEVEDVQMTSIEKFFSIEAERINKLAETIDFSQILDIAKLLIACKRVHIVAVGNTTPISMDLGFRLERAGISCTYSMLFEHYYNHIMLGSSDDVLIAISRSGASTQIIRAVELATKNHMKIIIITGELNKALVDPADFVIKIDEMKNEASTISKPDSHLQEFAINDVLLYVIRSIQSVNSTKESDLENKDSIGILLSEFKQ